MKIVLGLGNPSARYGPTRHNVGFRVVDLLVERARARVAGAGEGGSGTAWALEVRLAGRTVVLAKPRTYMNRSGAAALALCRRYDAAPGEVLVIHDDADLELGRIRIRTRGRDAGNRGLRSLIGALGTTEFPRIKLGVRGEGRDAADLADYVLRPFDRSEQEVVEEMIVAGADAVETVLAEGIAEAMNRFNRRPASAGPPDERN